MEGIMLKKLKKGLYLLACILFLCLFWPPSLFAQDTTTGIGFMADKDADWEEEDEYTLEVRDPYEHWNRKVFNFNHKLYKYVFTPLSQGYDFLVPQKLQSGFNNVFTNLRMPVRFFNNIFQGKFKGASTELGRFMINTTAGIGGLFNPADYAMKIKMYDEDFGQTLAHHGFSEGAFIMWPIIGPSNRRDTIGTILDTAFDPLFWFGILDVVLDDDILFGISAGKRVNNYTYYIRDNYDSLIDGAIDPYIALQNAYINNRNKKIKE
jgi:phospholipid-binding lipoprotein MlaA